jgi:hypothetical protein
MGVYKIGAVEPSELKSALDFEASGNNKNSGLDVWRDKAANLHKFEPKLAEIHPNLLRIELGQILPTPQIEITVMLKDFYERYRLMNLENDKHQRWWTRMWKELFIERFEMAEIYRQKLDDYLRSLALESALVAKERRAHQFEVEALGSGRLDNRTRFFEHMVTERIQFNKNLEMTEEFRSHLDSKLQDPEFARKISTFVRQRINSPVEFQFSIIQLNAAAPMAAMAYQQTAELAITPGKSNSTSKVLQISKVSKV